MIRRVTALRSIAAVCWVGTALPAPAVEHPRAIQSSRDAVTQDQLAWTIAEELTTEVGPRLAGSEAEARARDWAVRKLRALGFANVHVEPFDMPVWARGEERAEIYAPFPQPLAVTALGKSGVTPAGGLIAQVAAFDSLADLEAAGDDEVKGKIVFLNQAMIATQDGSSYGYYGSARRQGPSIASRKGAAAIVIRSIGTDHHRSPHTGIQSWGEGARPIPAGALSIPDAEQLQRILDRGRPVSMRLILTPRFVGPGRSANVVAEVPGSDRSAGTVLIGGHLDSWDLGTGAFDNASGVAITTAAAKAVMEAGRPRRTIRLVLFGAEEVGALGGDAYYDAHKSDGDVRVVAECDAGPDRIWRMQASFAAADKALTERLAARLAPLGVMRGPGAASAGADLGSWARAGAATVDLTTDNMRYFEYHHSADDTLDKIDPEQLRQNVAAWTAMLSVIANAPENISRLPARQP